MSLGSDQAKIEDHVHIARTAMDAAVWFHASPTYNCGFTYMILRMAFAAKAGISDWTDFCLRYARSIPNPQTTIGGTANLGHLNHFLSAARNALPLEKEVTAEIDLARRG